MYKGPKASLRSLSLSKGLRLKIAIAGAVVTVITVASVLTGVGLAQQVGDNLIGFEMLQYEVNEGANTVAFTVTVKAAGGVLDRGDVANLLFNTKDGTAISGAHFDGVSNQQISLNDQRDTVDIIVNILPDDVASGVRSFTVELTERLDLPDGVAIDPDRDVATITIVDDDLAGIGFADPPPIPEFVDGSTGQNNTPSFLDIYHVVVNEGSEASTATVTVGVLDPALIPAGEEVTLLVSTVDGTAKAGTDYEALPNDTEVTLTRQTPMVDIPIKILTTDNDLIFQPDNIFSVVLEMKPGTTLPRTFELDPVELRTNVAIKDNETVISFGELAYSIEEGTEDVNLEVSVVAYPFNGLEELTGGDAAIAVVTTEEGTATETHYKRQAGFDIALFFDNAGVREAFDIAIFGDDVLELPRSKEFYLNLQPDPFTALPAGVLIHPFFSRAVVTIEDDDPPAEIGFTLKDYLILENGGQQEVIVEVKSGTAPAGTTVLVSTVDGTAKAGGDESDDQDYIAQAAVELALDPTTAQRSVVIPINLDRFAEGSEQFEVVLSVDPDSVNRFGTTLDPEFSRANVTISDEIILTIGFVGAPYIVNEGTDTVTLEFGVLSEGISLVDERPIYIDYVTSHLDTDLTDYQFQRGTLRITSAKQRVSIEIPIVDDAEFEADEQFEVTLGVSERSVGPNAPAIQLNPGTARVRILDDDPRPPVTIEFENLSYDRSDPTAQPIPDGPIWENWGNDAARFVVSVPEPTPVQLEVDVGLVESLTSAVARGGGSLEFPAAPSVVIIPAGAQSARFTVGVTDDIIAEYDETFVVGVRGVQVGRFGGQIVQSGPDPDDKPVEVTVHSDDDLFLNLEHDEVYDEGESSLQVCITASNPYQLLGRHNLLLSVTDQLGNFPSDVSIFAGGMTYTTDLAEIPLIDGDTQTCVDITHATDDEVYSGNQVYDITLFGADDLPDLVVFGDAFSQYVFEDNDTPQFRFDFGGVTSIEEGETIDVVLELINGPPDGLPVGLERITLILDPVTSTISVPGDIAIYGGVGLPSDLFVSIPADTNQVTFPLRAIYDYRYDPDEQFQLGFDSVSTGLEFGVDSKLAITHTGTLSSPSPVIQIVETQGIRSEITVTPERVLEGQSVDVEITLDRHLGSSDIAKFEQEGYLDSSSMMFTETAIIVTVPFDIFTLDLTLDHDQSTYLIPLDEFTQTIVAEGDISKFIFTLNILNNNMPEPIEVAELLFEFPDLIDTAPEKAHEGFERSEVPLAFAIVDPNPVVEVDLDVRLNNVFAVEGDEAVLVLTLSEPLDYRLEEPYSPTFAAPPATDISDFEDISEIGTKIDDLSDSAQTTRQLPQGVNPFNFEFYGVNYDQIVVSSNGFLVPTRVDNLIAADQDTTNNVDLAVATPRRPRYLEQIIAPFWYELHGPIGDDGGVYEAVLGEYPSRRYIVQWKDFILDSDDGIRDAVDFQVVLFESSNDIEFRYNLINKEERAKATIGIADGDRYLQNSYDGNRPTPTPAGAAGNDAGTVPDRPQVVRENWKIAFRASAGDSLDGSVRVDVEARYRPDFDINFPIIIQLSDFVGTRYELPVRIRADGLVETNEKINFRLQNLPNGYQLPAGGGTAELEIRDTGELSIVLGLSESLSIRSLTNVEGETEELFLTLSEPLRADILYQYSDYVKHVEEYSAEEFEFIFDDISDRGTIVEGFGGVGQESRNRDDRWITRRPGFEFDLYDKSYNQLAININGLLAFAPPGANGGPTDLRAQHDFFDTANNQIPIGTSFLGTEPPFSVASERLHAPI